MKHDKEVQKAIDERFKDAKEDVIIHGYVIHGYRSKRADERFSPKKYWNWVGNNAAYDSYEDPRANPDKLAESDAFFKQRGDRKILYDKMMKKIDKLTPKEKRVLQMLANGKTMKETGEFLGLTVSGVQSFLNRIRKKFSSIKVRVQHPIYEDK